MAFMASSRAKFAFTFVRFFWLRIETIDRMKVTNFWVHKYGKIH